MFEAAAKQLAVLTFQITAEHPQKYLRSKSVFLGALASSCLHGWEDPLFWDPSA